MQGPRWTLECKENAQISDRQKPLPRVPRRGFALSDDQYDDGFLVKFGLRPSEAAAVPL